MSVNFLAHLLIITVSLRLILFPCFLFCTYFNDFPFEFVSANHCLSGCVAATTTLFSTWVPACCCFPATMAWILGLSSIHFLICFSLIVLTAFLSVSVTIIIIPFSLLLYKREHLIILIIITLIIIILILIN